LQAYTDALHGTDRLQAYRPTLLRGKAEGLIGADRAIHGMHLQRNPQFGQQFATTVRIDHLDFVTWGVVPQPPQAPHMSAQIGRGRVLGVVHVPSDRRLRLFTSGSCRFPLACAHLTKEAHT